MKIKNLYITSAILAVLGIILIFSSRADSQIGGGSGTINTLTQWTSSSTPDAIFPRTTNKAVGLWLQSASTQCLQVSAAGVISGTGAACGSGSGGSGNTVFELFNNVGIYATTTGKSLFVRGNHSATSSTALFEVAGDGHIHDLLTVGYINATGTATSTFSSSISIPDTYGIQFGSADTVLKSNIGAVGAGIFLLSGPSAIERGLYASGRLSLASNAGTNGTGNIEPIIVLSANGAAEISNGTQGNAADRILSFGFSNGVLVTDGSFNASTTIHADSNITTGGLFDSNGAGTSTFTGGISANHLSVTDALTVSGAGTSTFTGGIFANDLRTNLTSCDSLDTDTSGAIVCGSDATAAAGTNDWGTFITMSTGKNVTPSSTMDVAVQGELNVTGTGTSTIQGNTAVMGVLTVGPSSSSTIRSTTATSTLGGLIANHLQITKAITQNGGGTSTFTGGIFANTFRTNLPSCNSLDTDTDGALVCGVDADTTYTAGNNLSLTGTTFALKTNLFSLGDVFATTTGASVYASSTIQAGGNLIGYSLLDVRGAGTSTILNGIRADSGYFDTSLQIGGAGTTTLLGDSATSTFGGGVYANALRTNLVDCNTLDTDSTGALICGVDATAAAGTNDWGTFISLTPGKALTSSTTFDVAVQGELTVLGTGTSTNQGNSGVVGMLAVGATASSTIRGTDATSTLGGLRVNNISVTEAIIASGGGTSTFTGGISAGSGGLASSDGVSVTGGIIQSSGIINLSGSGTSTFAGGLIITAGGLDLDLPSCSGTNALNTDSGGAIICGAISGLTQDDLTDNSISDLSDVAAMTEATGDLLYVTGGAWDRLAAGTRGTILSMTTGGIPGWVSTSTFAHLNVNNVYTGSGTTTLRNNEEFYGKIAVGGTSTSTIRGGATSSLSGGLNVLTGGISFGLPSCTELTTDSTGAIICGTDDAGGGVNDWGTFIGMATGKNLTSSTTYDVGISGELNVLGTGTSTIQGGLAVMDKLSVGGTSSSTIRNTTATSTLGGLSINYLTVTEAINSSGGGTSTFTGGIYANTFRTNLPSCDSLDTDTDGALICGSDANSGGVNDWGTFITMATGKNITSSTTYDVAVGGELNVLGTGTSTIQGNVATMGVLTVGASASSTIRSTTATSTLGGLNINHLNVTEAITQNGGGTSTFVGGISTNHLTTTDTITSNGAGTSTFTGGIFANALRTNLVSCTTVLETDSNGAIVCGTDADTTYTAAANLALTGTVFSLKTNIFSMGDVFATTSSASIYASSTIQATGNLIGYADLLVGGTTTRWGGVTIEQQSGQGFLKPILVVGDSGTSTPFFIVNQHGQIITGSTSAAIQNSADATSTIGTIHAPYLIIDNGHAGTSTMTIGGVGNPACLKIRDKDNGGYSFCGVIDGVMTCSQTSC